MAKFIIEGNRVLEGSVHPSGNKNEALPALLTTLLTDEEIVLNNIQPIGDVLSVCEILKKLGVEIEWDRNQSVRLCSKAAHDFRPDKILCSRIRASILLLGPLLARFGKVELPLPGGDVIGARRIDTHWEGLTALGAKLNLEGSFISGQINNARGCDIYMDEPSVTATENLLFLAVASEGRTVLHNAACEPHVIGVCNLLNNMGAKISGIGSNRLEIVGVAKLHGAQHDIGLDFMEIGSFICLGAIAKGKIEIKGVKFDDHRFILKTFARIGIQVTFTGNSYIVDGRQVPVIKSDVSNRIATVYSGPWPAFPTDLMSVAIVAATQARGTLVFFEKMFEGRMFFTDKLMAMGANIVLCDPHRVVVNGPAQLYGATMSSPDVRAGMALLMASLIAKGKSEIDNTAQIERGYYQIERKLTELGAAITKV